MKIPWTLVAILLATGSLSAAANGGLSTTASVNRVAPIETRIWNAQTESLVKERLARLDLPFEMRPTDRVMSQIKRYVIAGYRDSEKIIGRSALYFPIFEHYLGQYNLPQELKYLPMIESGLKPRSRSYVGAVGLWQFMDMTANQYGLTINTVVDERLDPYRSTEAAVRMLSDLYDQFGDWSLALAAYNCGPGRVKRVLGANSTKAFWEIKGQLPQETQRYVPAFIAAAYVANYYQSHNIIPDFPSQKLRNTRTLLVKNRVSFTEIAERTGLDRQTIAYLNPGYTRYVVPGARHGNYLILPKEEALSIRQWFWEKATSGSAQLPQDKLKTTYTVREGEDIEKLATLFRCSVEDIMQWNGLQEPEVVVNQEIVVFLSKAFAFNRA